MSLKYLRLLMASALVSGSFLASAAQAKEPLKVYSVTQHLAYFAERLGGEAVSVSFPAPGGQDPAFWRPSITTIADYQRADLILLNGADYAQWVRNASLPRAALVDTARGLYDQLIQTQTVTHSHGEGGAHSHATTATHLWLNFDLAAAQAEAVFSALNRVLEPDLPDSHLDALKTDLAELNHLAELLPRNRAIIASHPRYQYLAERYGLSIRSVNWEANAEPTEADWAELDRLLKELPADVFIWEAEPTDASEQGILSRNLASTVFEPGDRAQADADFIELMQRNLSQLKAVLVAER